MPGAQGYEVFSTPDLDTEFAATPDAASATPTGTPTTTALPAGATDAYLPGNGKRWYAVTTVTTSHPKLQSQAVEANVTPELPELGRCVSATASKEGKTTVYNGAYTDNKCTKASPTKAGRYDWTSGPGALNHFTATIAKMTLESPG